MGVYFKPWRRKIGCITLLLACVFMSVWIRSMAAQPNPFGANLVDFHSLFGSPREEGALAGVGTYGNSLALLFDKETTFVFETSNASGSTIAASSTIQLVEKAETDRFVADDSAPILTSTTTAMMLMPTPAIAVPLWSIVIPLTLLSAYLLLSRPQQSTPKKPAELIANQGS